LTIAVSAFSGSSFPSFLSKDDYEIKISVFPVDPDGGASDSRWGRRWRSRQPHSYVERNALTLFQNTGSIPNFSESAFRTRRMNDANTDHAASGVQAKKKLPAFFTAFLLPPGSTTKCWFLASRQH
jgi:hypothetical protein